MARRSVSKLLPLALLGALVAAPTSAADPFYTRLLAEGTRALDTDPETAEQLLRTAAFGLLEEPDLLAAALVRLGIAQSRGRDGDGFRDTFDRLLVLEDRFGAYRAADLSETDHSAFEDAIPIHVSEERLRQSPLFSDLADRRLELKLARLPEREQRRELEARVSQQPRDPRRLLVIARFEAGKGKPKRALSWLDRLLAIDPENEEAHCLRGELAAARGDCDRAVSSLGRCARTPTEVGAAASELRCWVRQRRWREAAGLVDRLAPPLAGHPEIARLAAKIELPDETVPTTTPAPSAVAPETVATETVATETVAPETAAPDADAPPATTPPPAAPPEPSLEDRLTRLRARVVAAETPAQLDVAVDAAIELAEANLDSAAAQILAAEAAYRASRWETAVRIFDRAPPRPGEQPLLVFYHSVSLYESGRAGEAAAALQEVAPQLARTPFVEAYLTRILGPSASR